VATVGEDGMLRLWRADDAAPQGDMPSVGSSLYGVAFAVDGSFVAYGGADRALRVLPMDAGRPGSAEPRVIPLPEAQGAEIESLCALDDTRLAVAVGPLVLVVDLQEGGGARVLAKYPEVIARLAVSADGRLLAIVGHARTPMVVRVEDGIPVRTLPQHPSWTDGCGFSPDGAKLVTAGKDGVARLYDIASGTLEQRFVGHVGRVWDAQFDHEGRVLTAGADGTLRRWDARTPPDLAGVVVIPHGATRDTAVTATVVDGDRHVLLIGYDSVPTIPTRSPETVGRIDMLDPAIGELRTLPMVLPGSPRDLVIDRRCDLLVALPAKLPLVTFAGCSATTGPLPLIAGEPSLVGCSVATAANGHMAIGCQGGRLVCWSPAASRAVVIDRFEKNVDCLAVAPSSPAFLAAGSRRRVKLYDLGNLPHDLQTSGLRGVRTLPDLPGDVQALVWSPDGTRLVCGMNDGLVMVFDAATGATLGTLAAHERDLIGVAYLTDGRTLVTADNETVRISDAATLATLDEIRPGWRLFDLCVMEDGLGVAIVGGVHDSAVDGSPEAGRVGLIRVDPRPAEVPQ
ncbi:MAG: WD40 repeat domain-containing protein, partial [Planctomycetia bacterium]